MKVGEGSKKPMRDSILTENDVRLLDHDRRIHMGGTQLMVIQPSDTPLVNSPNALSFDTVLREKNEDCDVNKLCTILQKE
jgi:hypothetical protein